MTRSLKALSLFSGAGGLDLGIQNAGFEIVLGTDSDPWAAKSHQKNFPKSAFFTGDIQDFTKELAQEISGGRLDDIDLLIGGPPCPPFSKSRFYRTEMPRAMEDPVGAATIGGYLDTLSWLKPRAFLLENVAGMAFNVHRETLDHIIAHAQALGYACDWRVLNAADFGVPQIRQRFFLIGVREESFSWPTQSHADPKKELSLFDHWITAGEAIGDLDTPENADDAGHVAGGKYNHLLQEIPPGDNYLHFTKERGHPNPVFGWRKRYWSFLLKLSPDLPSWTIQARRSNNMGPLHWRNRILRIEEVKRLQTFPDDWYLSGSVERQWRQVGNAVPPRLAEVLGQQLSQCLLANARNLDKVA